MFDIFSGIIILDLTKVFSGPFATRILADYGATVIKIENPDSPDPARNFPPIIDKWSGYFELLNRNKESITLNLKNETDIIKFYKLVETADIVVENMTPSVKRKLNIDYKKLKKINKKIIYASLSGIDQKTDRKYFDVIAQAESGMMSITGINQPTKIGPAIVDAFSGQSLAFAISSALYKREKTKVGMYLSVSMLASALNLVEQNLIETSVTGKNPTLPGNQDQAIAPFGVYKTFDDPIVIAIGSEELWVEFKKIFDQKKLNQKIYFDNNMRIKNQDKLTKDIESIFRNYKSRKLIDLFRKHNIPSSKVNTMKDILDDPWFFSSGALYKSKKFVTTGQSIFDDSNKILSCKKAPRLGEHNKKYGI